MLTYVTGDRAPGTALDDAAARARVISRLRWRDVDLDTGALSVRRVLQRYGGAFHLDEPKTTRSRRTIKLPGPVSAALREHRTRQLEERLLAGSAWEAVPPDHGEGGIS